MRAAYVAVAACRRTIDQAPRGHPLAAKPIPAPRATREAIETGYLRLFEARAARDVARPRGYFGGGASPRPGR